MKDIPIAVTAASVVALMGAHANAGPTGNPMDYTQDITITSTSPLLNGSGSGTGSGAFDTNGELTVVSAVETKIGGGLFTGTVFSTTVYQGALAGTAWTYSGTSTASISGCTGSAVVCGNVTIGPGAPTTGNPTFTLDTLSGGAWNTMSSLAGLINLDVDHTLIPVPPLPGGPGDPTAVPTMSAYGLGFTAIALFGAAALRLRTSKKRK